MKTSVQKFWGMWPETILVVLCAVMADPAGAQMSAPTNPPAATMPTNLPAWLTRPLSMVDALNIAFQQNGTILKARSDVEANVGVAIQTRAILIPKLQASGAFNSSDPNLVPTLPGVPTAFPHENWNSGIQIVQSIYEGGRMLSSFRSARLIKEQAVDNYKTVVADTLLSTRVAYADVLVAAQQILVNDASVTLLSRELEDQQRRFDAGTVPRFNVLRAEVAVANERPSLIRARNAYRIAKNNLVDLLGFNLPRNVWEDIPLQLTDTLQATPYTVELPLALAQALEKRTELAALRKAQELQKENIVIARSGYKPSLHAFAGYDLNSSQYNTDLGQDLHGWVVGAQLNWNIFDGLLTHGKVVQATALYDKAQTDLADTSRRIESEVRTAYSSFVEAREVLESQEKVQEEAEEALRLARARAEAGTGTQLDVLDAETSLTQARTTQIQALHDYAVARARLERSIGQDMIELKGKE